MAGRQLTPGRRQERCLLGLLLLHPRQILPIERLADLLWDGAPPPQATRIIQSQIARLRAILGKQVIATSGRGYAANVDPDTVDACRFESEVRRAGNESDLARRSAILSAALALWRGPLLADCASDQLRERVGQGLAELQVKAVEDWLDAELQLGRHRDRVADLAANVAQYPDSERLTGLYMLALHRCGRTAEATAIFVELRNRLADSYGLDPGRWLTELYTGILRADPAFDWAPAAETTVRPALLPMDIFGFAGRTADLAKLDAVLQAGSQQPTATMICTVSGTAGVGKTSLVVHWAQRVRDRFPDGQLYVNLRGFDPRATRMEPTEAVRGFLHALGVAPAQVPATEDAQIALYRSMMADKRILVVLDNARDAEQVRPLLPGTAGCLVLVTSRVHLTSLTAAEGAQPLLLDLLSVEESGQLLARRLDPVRLAADPPATNMIIETCAGLPLALAVVAARARHSDRPLAAVAAELREGRLDGLHGGDESTDARAVFSWSYRALESDAAQLYRWLALHPGPSISVPAAASLAGVAPQQVRPTLVELVNSHLVTETEPGRYSCHDLLRAYAMELLAEHDGQEQTTAVSQRVIDHYLRTAQAAVMLLDPVRDPVPPTMPEPHVTPEPLAHHDEALAWLAAEYPVIVALIEQTTETDIRIWDLAWALGTFLDRRGLWHLIVVTHRAARTAALRCGDDLRLAQSERALGRAHVRLGRHDAAMAHLVAALEGFQYLGETVFQGHAHLELTRLQEVRQDYADALRHSQLAHALYDSVGYRVGQARAANNIGWQLAQLGRYAEALDWCEQALAVHVEVENPHGQANTLDSLGYIHHHLGQFDQARARFQRALDLFYELGDRFYVADVLTHLGQAEADAGDKDAALAAWQRALSILGDLEHPYARNVRLLIDAAGGVS